MFSWVWKCFKYPMCTDFKNFLLGLLGKKRQHQCTSPRLPPPLLGVWGKEKKFE